MTAMRLRQPDGRPTPPEVAGLSGAQRARRDRVVEAAIDLMGERPYDDVQMKDVAAASGVALGTLYRYFSSKEHVFAEALAAWSRRFERDLAVPAAGRNVDRLRLAYHRAVRAFERHPTVYGYLLAIQRTTDPAAATAFDGFARAQTEAFARFLPRVPSPRREEVVTVMNAVLDAGLRDWTLGRRAIGDVYAQIDSAARLLAG